MTSPQNQEKAEESVKQLDEVETIEPEPVEDEAPVSENEDEVKDTDEVLGNSEKTEETYNPPALFEEKSE